MGTSGSVKQIPVPSPEATVHVTSTLVLQFWNRFTSVRVATTSSRDVVGVVTNSGVVTGGVVLVGVGAVGVASVVSSGVGAGVCEFCNS